MSKKHNIIKHEQHLSAPTLAQTKLRCMFDKQELHNNDKQSHRTLEKLMVQFFVWLSNRTLKNFLYKTIYNYISFDSRLDFSDESKCYTHYKHLTLGDRILHVLMNCKWK